MLQSTQSATFAVTREQLERRLDAAAHRTPAEVRFTNGTVADVFSGTFLTDVDVLVTDGVVVDCVPTGSAEALETVDLEGGILLPGFIDAHVHIESSMLVPERFAELVLPHGTAVVVADPHEIANVLGTEGIRYMLDASEGLPLDIRFMLPSCVPATPFEHAGATLDAERLRPLYAHPRVLGLGEVMNVPGVLGKDPDLLQKLLDARTRARPIDGHAPGVLREALSACVVAGITSDHECSTLEEMRESIRRGMCVMIRQGSAAKNLPELIRGVTPENAHMCMFCNDDANPADIALEGHMEKHLRMAVAAGVPAMTAVRMATVNAANRFGLTESGAVAPGRRADFAVVEDLTHFRVRATYHGGRLTSRDGKLTAPLRRPLRPEGVLSRVRTGRVDADTFAIDVPSGRARVIGLVPHEILTMAHELPVRTESGKFDAALNPGLVKVAVLERHHALGTVGTGILSGYIEANAFMPGAVATTIAHDSHNIVVAGGSDADMLAAVERLREIGGGMTVVRDGRVLAELSLPCAGLMSFETGESIAAELEHVYRVARESFRIRDTVEPVMTLAFLALPVIPALRVTDEGLFDVLGWKHVAVDAER